MNRKTTWFHGILCLTIITLSCVSCAAQKGSAAGKPPVSADTTAGEADAGQAAVPVQPTAEDLTDDSPVAVIGDAEITGAEFRKRMIMENLPDPYGISSGEPVDPGALIKYMVGEKAAVMEARRQGLLQDPKIAWHAEQFIHNLLIQQIYLTQVKDKITVTEEDISDMLKKNAKWDRERARSMAYSQKARAMMDALSKQLVDALHVHKVKENFPQAAAIYRRLLEHPKEPRGKNVHWILKKQILEELDPNEGSLVLATFDGGQYTLMDLLKGIHAMVPTRRPGDLVIPAGIERFVDRSLASPLLVARARQLGLDKKPDVVAAIRDREDTFLMGLIRTMQNEGQDKPDKEAIQAYFDKIQASRHLDYKIKVRTVWYDTYEKALAARQTLDQGGSFDDLLTGTDSEQPAKEPRETTALAEGRFWDSLWNADPNTVVGPIQGFKGQDLAWRIVEVGAKVKGKPVELNSFFEDRIYGTLFSQQTKARMEAYYAELLKKYPHTIYRDRLAFFNPFKTP